MYVSNKNKSRSGKIDIKTVENKDGKQYLLVDNGRCFYITDGLYVWLEGKGLDCKLIETDSTSYKLAVCKEAIQSNLAYPNYRLCFMEFDSSYYKQIL